VKNEAEKDKEAVGKTIEGVTSEEQMEKENIS